MNPYINDAFDFSDGVSPNSSEDPSDPAVLQTSTSGLHPSSSQDGGPIRSLPVYVSPSFATENPYPPPAALHSPQLSVVDVEPSPQPIPGFDEDGPDLECSICFSQFNNLFRLPKMLHCKHTFCLECLARINVKSSDANAIQCPLCRGFTQLPSLGLPKLATDLDVMSYLPAAMQRVYSIRFIRNKGKLQVKRSTDSAGLAAASLRTGNRSLDVGLPSPPPEPQARRTSGVGRTLFQMTGRPACRAFLLTSVVLMMVLLTGIVIFLLVSTSNKQTN